MRILTVWNNVMWTLGERGWCAGICGFFFIFIDGRTEVQRKGGGVHGAFGWGQGR